MDEAVASLQKVVELGGRAAMYVAVLGLAYGATGRTEEAEALLAELEARSSREYVSPLCFADVLLGLGRNEEGAAWLEKAYEARSPALPVFFGTVRSFGVEATAGDLITDFSERLRLKSFGS